MIHRSRLVAIALAFALALSACGDDGVSAEERAAVVERLERLTADRPLAECIAKEFNDQYTVEDIEKYIAARDQLSTVNFELVEAMSVARTKCTDSDE